MVITPTSEMNSNLKKGSWSVEEDHMLISYIKRYGIWNWSQMPRFAGLSRSGKSCRLRWMNYLKPNIKKGKFSKEEEETILHFHSLLGNRWSAIASRLPGRTDNDVKNYWHSHLKKIASEQDSDDNPSPLFETTQQPADHDVFKSHFSFEHEASSSTSEDHKREFSSPGTFDDLQCFWDQLCPLENLEFGNNNNHMDAFYDDVFQDPNGDQISSYNWKLQDRDGLFPQ